MNEWSTVGEFLILTKLEIETQSRMEDLSLILQLPLHILAAKIYKSLLYLKTAFLQGMSVCIAMKYGERSISHCPNNEC